MENNTTPIMPVGPGCGCQSGQKPPTGTTPPSCDKMPVSCFGVGYTFVPVQKFNEMYMPAEGLSRGTIFPELDKPFGMQGVEVG